MSETDFNIEEAERQYNQARENVDEPTPPGDEEEPLPLAEVEEIEGDPDGFLSYEEYVANGGDPERYVGKKAYQDRYKDIESNRRMRGEISELKETVRMTMDATNAVLAQQREEVRAEVEAELEAAMENEDPKAAVAAQKKLDQIERAEAQPQAPKEESATIKTFREKNPVLDKGSDQFNEAFNRDMETIFNSYAMRGLTVTDDQTERALAASLKEAKALHPDLFESPRNQRQTNQQRTTKRQTREPTARAEDFQIDNPRNPNQVNAAPQVRDMIHKKALQQAKKNGKSDADAKAFADEAAANFEKQLLKKD